MATVGEIADIMEEIAGTQTLFEGDNVGLLLGSRQQSVKTVLCCLDVTDEVISQAIELKAELIISHHPLIFLPLRSILTATPLGARLARLIKNDISVYCAHTNLDSCPNGINQYTAQLAGLVDIQPMEGGLGRVGNLNPLTLGDFALKIKDAFNCFVGIVGERQKIISRAAIINGAGGGSEEYIDLALKKGAQCLITSEIKHHILLYAHQIGLGLIEIPHFWAEYCFIPQLKQLLDNACKRRGLQITLHAAREIHVKAEII